MQKSYSNPRRRSSFGCNFPASVPDHEDLLIGQYLSVSPAEPRLGFCANRGEAYASMRRAASTQSQIVTVYGRAIDLPAGSFLVSASMLAQEWNWTVKTTRIFLEALEMAGRITRKQWSPEGGYGATAHGHGKFPTMVTICDLAGSNQGGQS